MLAAAVKTITRRLPCSSAHVSDSPSLCARLREWRWFPRETSIVSANPRPTLNTLRDAYISNGRLLCVECRFTASQIMKRFAPLSHFSTDALQLLTLSIHPPMKSSYYIGEYRFLHRLDAIVEAGCLSPDIDALSILVRGIV